MVTQPIPYKILRIWTYDVRQFGIRPNESATELQEWLAKLVPPGILTSFSVLKCRDGFSILLYADN